MCADIRYDVVKAVLGADADDVVDALARAEAVKQVLHMPEFQAIGAACKRMRNILRQAEEKGITPAATFEDSARFRGGREEPGGLCRGQWSEGRRASQQERIWRGADVAFDRARASRCVFRQSDGDGGRCEVRANRLALLRTLLKEFSTIADFSEIVTESEESWKLRSRRDLGIW